MCSTHRLVGNNEWSQCCTKEHIKKVKGVQQGESFCKKGEPEPKLGEQCAMSSIPEVGGD